MGLGSMESRRGWAKVKYLEGDVNDFEELLYGYRLTFHVALADAHL